MNNDTYIEALPETKAKKPITQMIFCLVLGLFSVIFGGVGSIIAGIIAERLGGSVKANYPKSIFSRLSGLGGALGLIGAILSVVNIVLFFLVAVVIVWVVSGGSLFNIGII